MREWSDADRCRDCGQPRCWAGLTSICNPCVQRRLTKAWMERNAPNIVFLDADPLGIIDPMAAICE